MTKRIHGSMGWNDLEAAYQAHREEMDRAFRHDPLGDHLTVNISYEYVVDLARIPDQEALLGWVHHLLGKAWFETKHAKEFIDRVMTIKGWKLKQC